jgi:hypothetical protein
MTAAAATLIAVGLLVCRALLSAVAVGEIKAAWLRFLARSVEHAVRDLSADHRDDVLDEWLAELERLRDRPITALMYVRGLHTAAGALGVPATTARFGAVRRATKVLGRSVVGAVGYVGVLAAANLHIVALLIMAATNSRPSWAVGFVVVWSSLLWFAIIAGCLWGASSWFVRRRAVVAARRATR